MKPALQRHRQEGGSVMVMVAAMSLLLIAFVGLSVDGGEIQTQQRESQNAADGAALAAATAAINADTWGYVYQDAINIGRAVASYTGIPSSDVTFVMKDSTGSSTTDLTVAATVEADVSHTFPTLFLPVMDINTATVSAKAIISVTHPTGSNCAVCVLGSQSPSLTVTNGGGMTVTNGGVAVNSSGTPAMVSNNPGSTVGTYIHSVGSAGGGAYTPAPQTGPAYAFTDPLASVPLPANASGVNANDVTYSSSTTINPGTYGALTVPSGVTVTMSPGQYVFTGGWTINGTLQGSGVFMYFTCRTGASGSPTTPCASGASGGDLNISGSTNISAPAAGSQYTGLVFFGDRNNTAHINISSSVSFTGTVYGSNMYLYVGHGIHDSLTARMILGQIYIDNGGRLNTTYSASGNYVAPGKLQMTS